MSAGDDNAARVRVLLARRKALAPWVLMLPALIIVLVFFGIPTAYMARMSFNLHDGQGLYEPGFTFAHYGNMFTNPLFTGAIWTTVKLSLAASLCTVLIGFAFAQPASVFHQAPETPCQASAHHRLRLL